MRNCAFGPYDTFNSLHNNHDNTLHPRGWAWNNFIIIQTNNTFSDEHLNVERSRISYNIKRVTSRSRDAICRREGAAEHRSQGGGWKLITRLPSPRGI